MKLRSGWIFYASILLLPLHAGASPAELEALLQRPLLRYVFTYTPEGIALSRRILGARLGGTDGGFERLAHELSTERWQQFEHQLTPRLRDMEENVLSELENPGTAEESSARVAKVVTRHLAIHPTPGEISSPEAILFVSEPSSKNALTQNRELFLNEAGKTVKPGSDLSGTDLRARVLRGSDLRFTRWKGAHVGDASEARFQGADMRGALVDASSRLDGAIYDQFTALPFSRAEAKARGMEYRRSPGPEGYTSTDVEAVRRRAAKSGESVPEGASEIPQRIFAQLAELAPAQMEGVQLGSAPTYIQFRGTEWLRFEAGAIRPDSSNTAMRELVNELAADGGEVRRLILIDPKSGAILRERAAYFRLEGTKPIIGLSLGADTPTYFHERQHLRDWMELYRGQLAKGKSPE